MLNDETDFKAILSKVEMTVIAHAVLSSECYGQKFTDIKVLKVYEELLAFKLQENEGFYYETLQYSKFRFGKVYRMKVYNKTKIVSSLSPRSIFSY